MNCQPPDVTTVILGAANRRDAIDAMLAHLVEEGWFTIDDAAEIRDGLEKRHALGATTLGSGVAMPHLKHACVDKPLLALALLKNPNTDWGSIDGEPVDIVFLILTPFESNRLYQPYFERLHRRLAAGFGQKIRGSKTARDLADLLNSQDSNTCESL